MLHGIDVSNWQETVDWQKYKGEGIRFGLVKATEGATFTDAQFSRNWSQMAKYGMVRGAYHFGRPLNSATKDAEHFLTVVRRGGLETGDLLALDLETTDGATPDAVAEYARVWLSYVERQTGRRPLVYTFVSFARSGACKGLGAYPLWIAAPDYAAAHPPMPLGPWKDWVVHQYDDSPVDKDVTRLSPDELRALGGSTITTEDEMSEYVAVGMTKPLDFPAGTWTTLEFDTEYADNSHNHADAGGASVITGPAKYSLTCFVTISGLPVGAEGQIRLTRVSTKDGSDREPGPVQEFTATSGEQYLTYDIAVESIEDGRKTRIELIHWNSAAAKIVSAQFKGRVWG